MKRLALLLMLFAAGLMVASFAVAKPPPGHGQGNGHGHGKGRGDGSSTTGSSSTSSTSTTTTTAGDKKVWLCHKTGSLTKPWRKIHVNKHAEPGHLAHGDY